MMTFEEMPARLKAIGKDRAWLAEKSGYAKPTIDHAFSEKSPHKTEKMQRKLTDAIETEELAQGKAEIEKQGLFALEFTPQQFAEVDAASRKVDAPTLKDYCMDAVMIRTREIMGMPGNGLLKSVPSPTQKKKKNGA